MPYAIIQIDRLSQIIRHATRNKSTEVPVVSCPLLSAQQRATALEVHLFFIGVAVPIQIGLHRIVQKNVGTVRNLCSKQV